MTVYFDREYNPYGELCNWYWHHAPLIFEDKEYPTAEHLYQACKYQHSAAARAYAEAIRLCSTPHGAKLLGRRERLRMHGWQRRLCALIDQHAVAPDPDWESRKLAVMSAVLRLKFDQDSQCRKVLRGTGAARLVERSRDSYWGAGRDGRGANELGRLLEALRAELPSERSYQQ